MTELRRFFPLIATGMVVAVNAAANILPINGLTTGALSDLNPTGFTPAGWVFSIWTLIYLGVIAYALLCAFDGAEDRKRTDQIGNWYLASAAANIAWIFSWHYRHVELSLAVMFLLLGTLVAIYKILRRNPSNDWKQVLFVDGTFRIYVGWITTATIVNLAAVLHAQQSYPFGLEMNEWALMSVAAALGIYVWVCVSTRDALFGLVFAWAALGIFYKPVEITQPVKLIAATGVAVMTILIAWIVASSLRRRATS